MLLKFLQYSDLCLQRFSNSASPLLVFLGFGRILSIYFFYMPPLHYSGLELWWGQVSTHNVLLMEYFYSLEISCNVFGLYLPSFPSNSSQILPYLYTHPQLNVLFFLLNNQSNPVCAAHIFLGVSISCQGL